MSTLCKYALDNIFDGILISDAEGNVVYVNDQYEKITGIKREDVIGYSLYQLQENGVFNKSISLEAIKTRKTYSIIHRYVSGKSALTTAVPIMLGEELLGVVNNTRNIDDFLKIEKLLRDSEEEKQNLFTEMNMLRNLLSSPRDFICVSKRMKELLSSAAVVAPYDTTILINGESGTGKEVIASYIHNSSNRAGKAFIKVNCAAIPKELFESELFGYEKGAFTGARDSGKIGLFELANNGTLLLDEIGELPHEIQSKLLRAIQEKEIMRVGGEKCIPVDVRILAATNRDLQREAEKGNFREDLYFRLSVFPITIPPLRDRIEDIIPLVNYFLEKLNKKYKTTKTIDSEALKTLKGYSYPGNVRELENIVEYLYVMSIDRITMETIPGKVLSVVMMNTLNNPEFEVKRNLPELVDLYEKTIIEDMIRNYKTLESAGNLMGIHPSTLSRKMKKYGLKFE